MIKTSFERFIGRKVCSIDGVCPTICFSEGALLTIECSWRLRSEDSIIVGCSEYDSETTHKDVHCKLLDILIGKKIQKLILGNHISDLFIEFDGKLFLDIYNDSSLYESWALSDGTDFDIIALPGGDYCFSKE